MQNKQQHRKPQAHYRSDATIETCTKEQWPTIYHIIPPLVAHYGRNSAELRIPLRITENRPVMGFRPEFEENQKGSLRPPLVPK